MPGQQGSRPGWGSFFCQLPKSFPLLFTAGAEDPVGNNGKGVKAVYRRYLHHGANASIKLYPGDRHEILNELDRETVYADITNWINKE